MSTQKIKPTTALNIQLFLLRFTASIRNFLKKRGWKAQIDSDELFLTAFVEATKINPAPQTRAQLNI